MLQERLLQSGLPQVLLCSPQLLQTQWMRKQRLRQQWLRTDKRLRNARLLPRERSQRGLQTLLCGSPGLLPEELLPQESQVLWQQ